MWNPPEFGWSEGWKRAGDAFRRILPPSLGGGYDMGKPQDKAAKENLEKAYETPTSEIIFGGWETYAIYAGLFLLALVIIKD